MRHIRPAMTARKRFARTWLLSMVTLLVTVSCGGDSTGTVAATALRFSVQPTSVVAGAAFGVTVEFVGAGGARATGASDPVTITALGGGTVSGPASVATANGVAEFDGLMLTHAGTNVQLVATSGTLSAASTAFTVAVGPADLAHSAVDPAPCTTAPNAPFAMTFAFKDAYGNSLRSAGVTLSSSLAGSTLTPSSGVTSDTGTFATAFNSTTAGSAAITATVDGHQLAFTPSFVLASLGAPTPMAFPGSVTGTIPGAACKNGSAAALYSFTMPATGGAGFTLTTAFTPVFDVEQGGGLLNVRVTAATTPLTVEWLLPAGPFQFAIGTSAGAGAYSIVSTSVPANTGCSTRLLVAGGTYTGQALAAGDCDAYQDGSFADIFVMQSALPCTLTLQTSAFDNYFAVYDDVTSNQVGAFSHPALGVDAVIQLAACKSGDNPIDIIANSFLPGQSGAYTLIVALQGAGPANVRAMPVASRTQSPVSAGALARMLRVAAAKRGSH